MAREESRPDLVALEGLSASIIWDPPVSLRTLAALGTATFLTVAFIQLTTPTGCGGGSPVSRARQDLDTIRQAISLHDSQEPPLRGTSLRPLLGRYLQEIPLDPWGNPYLLDTHVGIVVSAGADGSLGLGDDYDDEDIIVRYKPELRISKAVFSGAGGVVRSGDTLTLTWNKSFRLRQGRDPLQDLVLVVRADAALTVPFSGGHLVDRLGVHKQYGDAEVG